MSLTAYLIGAGLTKALEIEGFPVPVMADFVPVMTRYVKNDVVLNLLVQMELGHVYESASEECEQYAQTLAGFIPAATDEQRAHFAGLVSARRTESIETLLARASKRAREDIYASSAENLVRYAINQVFSVIAWNLRLAALEAFLRHQFEDPESEHIFISFNYDLALDRSLACASNGLWQPKDGYGFTFPYYTTEDTTSDSPHGGVRAFSAGRLPQSSPKFRILKPHGSLNWLVRRSNSSGSRRPVASSGQMVLVLDTEWMIRYWPTSHTFNYVYGTDTSPRDFVILIIAPTPEKPPIMPQILASEAEAISMADRIFVVGYSLPPTDQEQERLLRDAVKQRKRPFEQLVVVNYRQPHEYFEKINSLFECFAWKAIKF